MALGIFPLMSKKEKRKYTSWSFFYSYKITTLLFSKKIIFLFSIILYHFSVNSKWGDKWIHAFLKCISAAGNASSLIQDLKYSSFHSSKYQKNYLRALNLWEPFSRQIYRTKAEDMIMFNEFQARIIRNMKECPIAISLLFSKLHLQHENEWCHAAKSFPEPDEGFSIQINHLKKLFALWSITH